MAPAESSELNKNLAFVEGDTWPGIPLVTFSTPPSENLESIRMSFRQSFVATRTMVKLSSDNGEIVILDPVTWSFKVPHQPLPLAAGSYVWQIETTDAIGRISTPMQGSIQVLSDIVEPNQVITGNATEYQSYYPCWSSSAVSVYTAFGQLLNIGTPVYSDQNLSLPLAQDFAYQGTLYTVVDGKIDSISACAVDTYTIASSCDSPLNSSIYTVPGDGFSGFIYNDPTLSVLRNTPFSIGGVLYEVSGGLVTSTSPCYPTSWEIKDSCYGSPPYLIYTSSYDTILQNGVAVFLDSGLTTPFPSASFAYSGIIYYTSLGVITGTAICPAVEQWSGFQDCSITSPSVTAYSAPGSTLTVGTYLYMDNELTVPYSFGSFRLGGTSYTLVSGQIDSVSTCSSNTYEVLDGCGSSTTFTLYSLNFYPEDPIPLGTVMYEDSSLTIPFIGGTFGGYFSYNSKQYTTSALTGEITSVTECS